MPRFFFDVHDGHSQIDHEGTDLRDDDHARYEAVRLAGALLSEHAGRIKSGEDWHLNVRDEGGTLLRRVGVTLADKPAVA